MSERDPLYVEIEELRASLAAARTEIHVLRNALDELVDHHCGGVCSEDEEARGYKPHSKVMAVIDKALSQNE